MPEPRASKPYVPRKWRCGINLSKTAYQKDFDACDFFLRDELKKHYELTGDRRRDGYWGVRCPRQLMTYDNQLFKETFSIELLDYTTDTLKICGYPLYYVRLHGTNPGVREARHSRLEFYFLSGEAPIAIPWLVENLAVVKVIPPWLRQRTTDSKRSPISVEPGEPLDRPVWTYEALASMDALDELKKSAWLRHRHPEYTVDLRDEIFEQM